MTNFGEHVSFIWFIAEILRCNYKQSEYGKLVLGQIDNLPASVDHEMRKTILNMAAEQDVSAV